MYGEYWCLPLPKEVGCEHNAEVAWGHEVVFDMLSVADSIMMEIRHR